jgi:hypothetical protein
MLSSPRQREKIMSRSSSLLVIGTMLLSSGAIAQTAPAAKAVKDPDRIVCQRIEETGSRLGGKKVCMTAAQWAAQRQADKDLTDHLQQQTYKNN